MNTDMFKSDFNLSKLLSNKLLLKDSDMNRTCIAHLLLTPYRIDYKGTRNIK